MLKKELIYREILYQVENNNKIITQLSLSKLFNISLSTVNNALNPLKQMNAVKVNLKNFIVIDAKKLLYYWASIRNLSKDIIYSTRVDMPVHKIEQMMPDNIIFGAYSAYKLKCNDVPADYSEVYVYGDESLKERFPKNNMPPNLFILQKDNFIERYGKTTTLTNTFVDLWNINTWYANEFLKAIEAKINGILE